MTSGSLVVDDVLPVYHHRRVHEIGCACSPEGAMAALRRCDLASSRVIRVLFTLRGLPRRDLTIEGLERIGFRVLGIREGREMALGLIGRFWRPGGGLVDFAAGEFAGFEEPGFVKVVDSYQVSPSPSGSTLLCETRIRCTSSDSRRAFGRYWAVVAPFSGLVRRRWLLLARRAAESRR